MGRSDVDAFMKWLEGYESWYDQHSDLWTIIMTVCKAASFLAALGTVALSIFMKQGVFDAGGRWIIIASTLIATASSEFVAQFKVREMEDLREDGDLEMKDIVAEARQRFAEAEGDENRISALMDDYRKRVNKLEVKQHRSHSKIRDRKDRFGKGR